MGIPLRTNASFPYKHCYIFLTGQLAMIVEVMPSGDLCNLLRKSKKRASEKGIPIVEMIDEKEFLQFSVDIASGMAHLAEHNVSPCKQTYCSFLSFS